MSGGTQLNVQNKVAREVDVTSLLRDMWRIRLVEERIAQLYSEQEMRCPVHLSIGQEAVAVGVCSQLTASDGVLSGHRAHAHYLAKGGDLPRMLAELYGKETGCCGGRGGSMHLMDRAAGFLASTPIVGSTIPIATGVAWAEKMQRSRGTIVAFFGEGAMEEGVWHESVNFASLHKLPILYVCENNLYSVYTHLRDRQPERSRVKLAAAHGLAAFHADGNDVIAVQETTIQAMKGVRAGAGPAFIECSTYRWREHCGPNFDNDIGYRTKAEFEEWQKQDPLARLLGFARQEKGIGEDVLAKIRLNIEEEIEAAVTFAQESPFPDPAAMRPQNAYA